MLIPWFGGEVGCEIYCKNRECGEGDVNPKTTENIVLHGERKKWRWQCRTYGSRNTNSSSGKSICRSKGTPIRSGSGNKNKNNTWRWNVLLRKMKVRYMTIPNAIFMRIISASKRPIKHQTPNDSAPHPRATKLINGSIKNIGIKVDMERMKVFRSPHRRTIRAKKNNWNRASTRPSDPMI